MRSDLSAFLFGALIAALVAWWLWRGGGAQLAKLGAAAGAGGAGSGAGGALDAGTLTPADCGCGGAAAARRGGWLSAPARTQIPNTPPR